jgi:putative heme-binding domain-containing protein
MFSRFCLLPLLALLPLAAQQHSETALTNPFNSPDDRARGSVFFRSQCASCHGADGKGGATGPSLASGTFRHATSDEGLFQVITKGVPGTVMPGFSLNGREIWQIVAHIRSLSGAKNVQVTGDAVKGRELFQSRGCAACHSVAGEGAPRGVDLTSIGARLSIGELRSALLDPSAEVAPEYWFWQAKTKDGRVLNGRRLNEDTFSVQIVQMDGKLVSLSKAALQSQTLERRSPMPPLRGRISDSDLNDLIAYVSSLRGYAQ